MKLLANLRAVHWHWPVLGALLIGSLLSPSAREMHLLCVRLIFGLKGETVVRGVSPGCIINNFPYVEFTTEQQKELRRRSNKSPDDYALACTTGDYFKLDFPAATTWTNHALLTWGATRLTWIAIRKREDAESTNATVSIAAADEAVKTARQIIALARSLNPTNGGLWQAEAAACFAEQDDAAALTALETAASFSRWSGDTENVFKYLVNLFDQAGLSMLDAATEANSQSPHTWVAAPQGIIKKHLNRLMAAAVNKGEDEKFGKLLGLVVELRKADWQDKHIDLWNGFRNFSANDELTIAMAGRMGRKLPTHFSEEGLTAQSYVEENRDFRSKVFSDFLDKHVETRIAARFLGQRDTEYASRTYRHRAQDQHFHSVIRPWFWAAIAGCASVLMLGLVLLFAISELPLTWLRRIGTPSGELPRHYLFWIAWVGGVVVGSMILFRIASALGMGDSSQRGFGIYEDPPAISPTVGATLHAFLLVGAWQLIVLTIWKTNKKPISVWPAIALLAELYLVAILFAGFFRDETVTILQSQFF